MEVIAIASSSFSKNPTLRETILKTFPNSDFRFNDKGKRLAGEELVNFLKGADQAIIALEKIDASLLSQLPSLRHISKYGVGLDKIDFEALKQSNVSISHVQGVNKRGVAELALTFMLNLCSKCFLNAHRLKGASWKLESGNLLTGKTVGVLGCGNVGKELVTLVKPFTDNIIAHDIKVDEEFFSKNNVVSVDLNTLFHNSDFISIHLPLTDQTKNIIALNELKQMKLNSFLINTSRGGIVEENDLFLALHEGMIAGAASDVFLDEPNTDSPLFLLNNFIATPHMGGSAQESVLAMGEAAINGLKSN